MSSQASMQAHRAVLATSSIRLNRYLSAQSWLTALTAGRRNLARLGGYIRENPTLFIAQVLAATLCITTLFSLPILGAVGFSATGPVAGSAAAAWQASLGIVEAGSLFAWCQSAAMGGAALGTIMSTGATVGTVAIATTVIRAKAQEVAGFGQQVKQKLRALWG